MKTITNPSREYLKHLTAQERSELAKKAAQHLPVKENGRAKESLHPRTISFIGDGRRFPSQELQVALEIASGHRVRAEDFIAELRFRMAS